MYLVMEWTTMSAPCAIGRHRYGDGMVLSTTSGMPAPRDLGDRLQVADHAVRIGRASSTKIALVLLRIAFWNSLGLRDRRSGRASRTGERSR